MERRYLSLIKKAEFIPGSKPVKNQNLEGLKPSLNHAYVSL